MSKFTVTSDSWLLSYSDLFLLVLSFFVLRHPLLQKPNDMTVKVTADQQTLAPEHVFLQNPVLKNTNDFDIEKSWFDNQGELTNIGERTLSLIRLQAKNSSGLVKIQFQEHPDKDLLLSSSQVKLQNIISKLSANDIKEIELTYTVGSTDEDLFGQILLIH